MAKVLNPPNKWPDTENAKEVLFFSLQLRECVQLKVWESYRAYSLSTLMRLKEIQVIASLIKNRKIGKSVLTPCLEEISHSLPKDHVAKMLLPEYELADFCKHQFSIDNPVDDLSNSASLLETLMQEGYQRQCEELIVDYCFGNANKIKLREVTKLYASHLINSGISRKYIHLTTKEIFFQNDLKRVTKNKLISFFTRFKTNNKSYRVFIGVNNNFVKYGYKVFPGKIHSDVEILNATLDFNLPDDIGSNKKYSIWEYSLQAKDSHSAFLLGQRTLMLIESLLFLYPHYSSASKYRSNGFVVQGRSKTGILCTRDEPALTHNRAMPDSKLFDSFKQLSKSLFKPGGMDQISRARMIRTATTASLAGKSDSLENQLVSIWAAFETLLPNLDIDSKSRINYFCDHLLPCTTFKYTKETFIHLNRSLNDDFGEEYRNFIDLIGTNGTRDVRLFRIIAGQNKEQQRQLLTIVNTSPLALNRLGYLNNIFKSYKDYLSYTADHEKRVRWQMYRIYRERNNIVHTGKKSSFLEPLVANAINYFRGSCENIITFQATHSLNTVDECISGIRYNYQTRKKFYLTDDDKNLQLNVERYEFNIG